jgi:hypothetical protein
MLAFVDVIIGAAYADMAVRKADFPGPQRPRFSSIDGHELAGCVANDCFHYGFSSAGWSGRHRRDEGIKSTGNAALHI